MNIIGLKRIFFEQLSLYMTCICILLSFTGHASELNCHKTIERIFQKRNSVLFSLSKRFYNNVDMSFLRNSDVNSKEKSKKLFNIYIENTKHRLNKEEQKELDRLIQDRQYTSAIELNGAYRYETAKKSGQISLQLPIRLENTFLEYSLLVHEVEHAIKQILSKRKSIKAQTYKELQSKGSYERTYFLDEMGAMSAEWIYLSAIPKEEIESLKRVVNKLKRELTENEISLIESSLEAPNLELHEYLESNWKKKRYDYWGIKQKRLDYDLNNSDDMKNLEKKFFQGLAAATTASSLIIYKLFFYEDKEED